MLRIIPCTLREAQAFVQVHHRHNDSPTGHKLSIALIDCERLVVVGVACLGRPIARNFDDGLTSEINRTCTTGEPNANSMLYGAAWRAAKAMGYTRCITYTQADESGKSLHAAGWRRVKELPPRKSWGASTKNPRLKAMRDPEGSGGVARVLWEITCTPDRARHSEQDSLAQTLVKRATRDALFPMEALKATRPKRPCRKRKIEEE